MDRAKTVTRSERAWVRRGPADEFVLPSRAEALSGLASALESRGGPVLLTGEPGVGKTWVSRKLRDAMPASWRWAVVDLSPVIDPGGFLRLILHALGSVQPGGPAELRGAVREVLAEGADDGREWGLIVEEGQNASSGVLEELRILGNRMGESGAFSGLILIGQNGLARRLATRPFAPFQARVAARVHLRPLDVDELHGWVGRIEPGRSWDLDSVERLHRETAGNPRRVRSLTARTTGHAPAPAPAPVETELPRPAAPPRVAALAKPEPWESVRIPDCESPPVAPGKPPLRVGDGMIEVGWEPTAEPDPEPEPGRGLLSGRSIPSIALQDSAPARGPLGTGLFETVETVEVIDDHYAALQAWTEWAENQGREPVAGPSALGGNSRAVSTTTGETEEDGADEAEPSSAVSGLEGVRVESQHDFAPYSQLFSRLRQPRDNA